jgi:hypothetical protein
VSESAADPDPVDGDAREWAAHVSALRAQVRRDRRATSLPLLLLGAAAAAGVIPQLLPAASGWWISAGDWLAGVLMTAAFVVLWLVYRRRALQGGVGSSAGFGAAAVLGLACTASIAAVAMSFTGPFLIFGLGLLFVGIWQRNRFLAGWATVIGGIGVFEGFFGITNRISASAWRQWEHPAIYLALALLTVAAGLVARRRENRAP